MSEVKRIKRSELEWRELFARHEMSGLPVSRFCAETGIHPGVFRRWRQALMGTKPASDSGAEGVKAQPAFIELGALSSKVPEWQVRVELGGGVVLSMARG